jgi:F0F1-type ATP synthase epsilon subunit
MSEISPQKIRILEKETEREREKEKKKERKRKRKKGARIEKQNRWNLVWRSSMFQKEKKKRGWNLQATGRDSIERKKGDHIFL